MIETANAASKTPPQKPRGPRPNWAISAYAMNAPSMYSEPCAKLTMRVTPKISVKPAATRNSAEAPARPFNSWTKNEARDTAGQVQFPEDAGPDAGPKIASVRRPQLLHLVVGWQVILAVGVAPIHHHALAILHRRAAHVGAHRRLM